MARDFGESRHWFEKHVGHSPDVVLRQVVIGGERGLRALVVYVDSLCNPEFISESIIEKLLAHEGDRLTRTNALRVVQERLLTTGNVQRVDTYEQAIGQVLNGRAVVVVEGTPAALACEVPGFSTRAIEEPETESVAQGPREGFTEHIQDNISLLRRKLRTHNLRFEPFVLGRYTRTHVMLAYLDGVAPLEIVDEARSRLQRIGEEVDGVLLSETIAEFIEDHPLSLFPTISSTERPERVAAALLEGRFAILVDGTPFTLTAPTLFAEFLTITADYSERPLIGSFLRIVRHGSLYGALFTPSIYVALVSFHQEMIPTLLMLSILTGREGVPFPAVLEALFMETAFEILREAGLRLPRAIGGAISIVGVLVVGQAAVAAGIVSPAMIIVVGATAIASFTIPNYPAANALRLLRFPILLITGAFGALGIALSFILLTLHVVSLRSFGMPYLAPLAPFNAVANQDVAVRLPMWTMRKRPQVLGYRNFRRQQDSLMPRGLRGAGRRGTRQN